MKKIIILTFIVLFLFSLSSFVNAGILDIFKDKPVIKQTPTSSFTLSNFANQHEVLK